MTRIREEEEDYINTYEVHNVRSETESEVLKLKLVSSTQNDED